MNRILLASLLAAIGTGALAQTASTPGASRDADTNAAASTAPSSTPSSAAHGMNAILTLIEQANAEIKRDEPQRALTLLESADLQIGRTMQQASQAQRASLQTTRERIRAARSALREQDVAGARKSVEVAADESRRFDADLQAQLQIAVPRPEVTVEQADPQVRVEPRAPRVDVDPGRPQVTVNQPAPQVTVAMAQPTVTIDMPRPEIIVEMPDPSVSVDAQPPRVTVNQPRPTVRVEQGSPKVQLGDADSSVDRPADQAKSDSAAARADSAEGQPPANVEIDPGQPQVSTTGVQQAQVNVAEVEPQVRYQAAEPQVRVERTGEPVVRFNQTGEPDVRIRQLDAEQTRAMASGTGGSGDQQANGRDASQQPSGQDASQQASGRMESEMTAGRLADRDIVGENGSTIGDIEKLVEIDGQVYAVIGSGGFLGLGENQTAIPVTALGMRGDQVMLSQAEEGRSQALRDFDAASHEALPSDHAITLGGG